MAKFVSNNSSSAYVVLYFLIPTGTQNGNAKPSMHSMMYHHVCIGIKRVVIGSNFALNYTMCNPIEISRTAQGVM